MIEYINLLLLLTMFGSTCYVYYRLKKIFYLISIVIDSEILDQLTDLGTDVDSEFPKPKRGHKKKADTKINELEDNDVRDKRERLVACVLSGNSKMYLGKEYTEQQINEMDCTNVNTLLNRYESVLSAQMTKSLGKSVINFVFKHSLQCARCWQSAKTLSSVSIHVLHTLLCIDDVTGPYCMPSTVLMMHLHTDRVTHLY